MSGIATISSSRTQLYYAAAVGAADSAPGGPLDAETAANVPALPQTTSSSGTNPPGTNSAATAPLSDLRQQLESAITQSVDQLPAGSSSQDAFQAIRSAVESTLKANGIDSQPAPGLSTHRGHHHGHRAAAADQAEGASSAAGSSGNDGNDDDGGGANATDPLLAPGTASADALTQLLQALSAGENSASSPASGKSANRSSLDAGSLASSTPGLPAIFRQLFQGFPSGTGLDVLA